MQSLIVSHAIFFRTRAFNIIQLVDFTTNRLSEFYFRKLVEFGNGRRAPIKRRGDGSSGDTVPTEAIVKVGQ